MPGSVGESGAQGKIPIESFFALEAIIFWFLASSSRWGEIPGYSGES
jgi:hypothetical protein